MARAGVGTPIAPDDPVFKADPSFRRQIDAATVPAADGTLYDRGTDRCALAAIAADAMMEASEAGRGVDVSPGSKARAEQRALETLAQILPVTLGRTTYRVAYGTSRPHGGSLSLIGPRGGFSELVQSMRDPSWWAHNTMSGHTVRTVWYKAEPDGSFVQS